MGSPPFLTITFIIISLASHTSSTMAADTLSPARNLTDGQTLVSSNQRFELGFFTPGGSSNRYLGIRYHNLPLTVVWVANKANPVLDSSGSLTLTSNGVLLLRNRSTGLLWSTNQTITAKSPVLQLLDTGNLVVTESDGNSFLWESFDDMSDTLLPGMKLGWDLQINLNRFMRSWKSSDDPSDGDFSFSLDPPESPQLVLRRGSQKQYRWGPFDGKGFSGSNELRANPVFQPLFVYNADEVYYEFQQQDESVLLRFQVTPLGLVQYFTWRLGSSTEWSMMVTLNRDYCDSYGMCGPYGNCYSDDPNCRCIDGFTPTSPQDWKLVDWKDGCTRKYELNCSNRDGFVRYTGLKLPDNSTVWPNFSQSPETCRAECLRTCGCMAYANIDVHGNGSRCVVWLGQLIDMRSFPNGGEELYIRMAHAELEAIASAKRKKLAVKISVIVILTAIGMLLFSVVGWYIHHIRAKRKALAYIPYDNPEEESHPDDNLKLPLFHLDTIVVATDNFSYEKKIGQGGFGAVYKGELPNGKEIAVKRLSQNSGQGLKELKNEVILIAKLQHRNLVKLLGCCIQGEEGMLVYEYLPNKSLDGFLYDQKRKTLVPWTKRFNIILGIARGLLYLHQDSRLRIIHRDLKTSNILLDNEMNPKISDFGIARIFRGDQTEEKTKRVIGTYGYMSPEYAMSGHFSVKSDVFSFGVIVLEIISGQKNWLFCHSDHDLNLIGYAWKLWNEGLPLELMDTLLEESYVPNEVVRCIHVALLCVQQRAEDRPTMSNVVFMLSNEGAELPQPKEPGFPTESSAKKAKSSSTGQTSNPTANDMTITAVDGR